MGSSAPSSTVIQHHNCDLGLAGKTTSLTLRYRRPTPLLTALRFDPSAVDDRRIRIDGTAACTAPSLLCEAVIESIAERREALPDVAPRRRVP